MLTAQRLRAVLAYDAGTGDFTWLVQPNGRVSAGAAAGRTNSLGYRQIQVDGRLYLAHRLAWLHVYGEWPSLDLDHADRNKANNAITNLREATRSQNLANTKTARHNVCGIKGVGWDAGVGKYRARLSVNGKRRTVGYFDTASEAGEAYRAAAIEAFGDFGREAA